MIVGRVILTDKNDLHFLLQDSYVGYDLEKRSIHISSFNTNNSNDHVVEFLNEIQSFVKSKTKKWSIFYKPYRIEMGVHQMAGLHSLNKHLDFMHFFLCNEVEIYLTTDPVKVFFEKEQLDYPLLAKRQYSLGNSATQYFNGYQNITPEL